MTNTNSSNDAYDANLEDVLAKINELAKKSTAANYIYRGEPECYSKVSSTLYRDLTPDLAVTASMKRVQDMELEEARKFTFDDDDFVILTDLQHFGGKTNLIDFTADYLIALFFACDGRHTQEGRIVFLDRFGDMHDHIIGPRNPANRVIAQKSIFVMPPMGYIEPDDIVTIPGNLKRSVLDHLRKAHGISAETIYNDVHGFIKYRQIHQDAIRKFNAGFEAANNGDHREAINLYTASLDQNPNLAMAYYNRGTAKANLLEYEGAVDDYDRAIELAPGYSVVYYNRGAAKAHLHDYAAAIADYDQAIELDPGYAMAYNNRGAAKAENDDQHAATADYNRAIELDPGYAMAYNNRGTAKTAQADYDGALADYNRAIELDPGYAMAYNNRGTVKADQADYDGALADYNRAIELDPDDVLIYYNRGTTKLRISDYTGALADYDRVIELTPDDPAAYYDRAEVWLHLSKWNKAKTDLTTAQNMGLDIVDSFHIDYESVAVFELRNGITLPDDIAEMLGG